MSRTIHLAVLAALFVSAVKSPAYLPATSPLTEEMAVVDHLFAETGRRPRLPVNLAEALRQLDEKCDQWNRWIDHLEAVGEDASQFSAAQLPSRLRTKIQAVTLAMSVLAKEVAKLQ